VELFALTAPEQSDDVLESIVQLQQEIFTYHHHRHHRNLIAALAYIAAHAHAHARNTTHAR
jgi:superoxide dismutase